MNHPRILLRRISVILFFVSTLASAQTYSVLYDYPETNRNNTGVFSQVFAQGRDANLYSTISNGGTDSAGTAYQMTPAGQLTTLYNFCSLTSCADGSNPLGGLTLGFDGNFYGTTQVGGTKGAGTIFQLTPTGTLTTLYDFTNGNDDSAPTYTLVQGQDDNLYGVSEEQYNGQNGSFFKVSPSGKFTLLYDFDFTHGSSPNVPTQGTDGNFYGTTVFGGSSNVGVIYKLTSSGAITVLHNFGGYANGDGAYPLGMLVQGNDGNFYGITKEGGAHNQGTVFKITASGTYTLLYSFNYNAQTLDGQLPFTGLTLGTDGNFYGTTAEGGKNGNTGTIFQITPSGQEKILYNFCSQTGCLDGLAPEAPLLQHSNGKFYGATTGNSLGGGVFYSLDMGLEPFVDLLNWEGKVSATIEILGQGFTGTTKVLFNGTPATFDSVSDTYMTAVVPEGATTGNITVKTATSTMKSSRRFLVTPQIKAFSPTSGPVGTVVTINGDSLTQTKGVGFGDYVPAKFTVNSDQQITATVPEGAKTGPVGVETAGGLAVFGKFTVTPAVLSSSPTQGTEGTPVTIHGTGSLEQPK